MKILLTGATGFIGSAFTRQALARGHQLAALIIPSESIPPNLAATSNLAWLRGTLDDAPWKDITALAPDVCLHMAWITTPGIYLESPENFRFVESSIRFLRKIRETGTTHENGTVFRILELQSGNSPRNHRTDSLDYAVIMSGEIDMELDGSTTHLKAGDVVVQRGTVHNWVNRGTEPCVIAFVLIAAKPVEIGGKVLQAFG